MAPLPKGTMRTGLLALRADFEVLLGLTPSPDAPTPVYCPKMTGICLLFIFTCESCGSIDSLAHRNAKRPHTLPNSRFGLQFPETARLSLQCSFYSVRFHQNVTIWKAKDIFQLEIIQDIVSSYPPTPFWVIWYPEFQASAQETTSFLKTNIRVCLICNRWMLVKLMFYCYSLWICWLGCHFHSETLLALYSWTPLW